MNRTFFWHDYETFGANPRRDRPAQFAGVRTNEQLELIEDPVCLYCKPGLEVLPDPQAVLITGITPQRAQEEGLNEYDFAWAVEQHLGHPGTCGVGYNSIRFDDEVTRFLFYRNLISPYDREWAEGNSRWDLIDVVRACYALRPHGIQWPRHEDGKPSFRLEDLARANHIEQIQAHDALSDVLATIELARRIRDHQPRLFQHALRLRDKQWVREQIRWQDRQPLVHVSARFPAERGCLAIVVPLAPEPGNGNGFICANLDQDPDVWLDLEPGELADRLFCPAADLPEDIERPALKAIHANRSPFIAPLGVLKGVDLERIGLDFDRCMRHLEKIRQARSLPDWYRVFQPLDRSHLDAELALYQGFIQDDDKDRMMIFHNQPAESWSAQAPVFDDPRLNTLRFRLVARTHPEQLKPEEQQAWLDWCRKRLQDPDLVPVPWHEYPALLQQLQQQQATPELSALRQWMEHLAQALDLPLPDLDTRPEQP